MSRKFTERDIKMVDCPEIQARQPVVDVNERWIWDWRQGSVFWLPKDEEFALYHWDNDEGHFMIGGYHSCLDGKVWIPLEHQLWEMPKGTTRKKLKRFYNWLNDAPFVSIGTAIVREEAFISENDLWELLIQFVYHELYGKRWDDDREKWVKEG